MFDYGNWDEFDYQGPTKNKTTLFFEIFKNNFLKNIQDQIGIGSKISLNKCVTKYITSLRPRSKNSIGCLHKKLQTITTIKITPIHGFLRAKDHPAVCFKCLETRTHIKIKKTN